MMPLTSGTPTKLLTFLLIVGFNINLGSTQNRDYWSLSDWFREAGGHNPNWGGRWFPYSPSEGVDNNQVVPGHRIAMGIKNPQCDDGQTNLTIDWDLNPVNYTCFLSKGERERYEPQSSVPSLLTKYHIPSGYRAPHACMTDIIVYDDLIPTFGNHRPLWPKWGEYTFVPRQRWLHNAEHGGVIMLYHPCADKNEVQKLRKLVNGCLYRHIISPSNFLEPRRPLCLVTWGYRLEMSKVSTETVTKFIRDHALQGPEQVSTDGQYDLMLLEHSELASDIDDTVLCGNI